MRGPIETFIGVHLAHQIAWGVMSNDRELLDPPRIVPTHGRLSSMPAEEIVQTVVREFDHVESLGPVQALGLGVPGLVEHGVIQESPNLPQLKGFQLQSELYDAFRGTRLTRVPVFVFNDADALAAGMAAHRAELRGPIRIWTLGRGVGLGRYPSLDRAWEGGHVVVTLDPNENHCSCGGIGHLEGIVGLRSMRLRFLDREPEEVFESAKNGDEPAHAFVTLWHRALAAATASCVHLDGPGEFFITGASSDFINVELLTQHLDSMIGMTSLQGSTFSIIAQTEQIGVIGAAFNAQTELAHDPRLQHA